MGLVETALAAGALGAVALGSRLALARRREAVYQAYRRARRGWPPDPPEGVREPRRPRPTSGAGAATAD